jgi:subtilisin family serine protease
VAQAGAGTAIPGQYIVVFRNSVSDISGEAQRLANAHGGTVSHVYRSALHGMALSLPDQAVAALRNEPSVALVEPDQVMSLVTTESNATWGIDRIDQHSLPLDQSYTYNADGSGVTVYIIDTGINFTHNEYVGRASTGIDEVTSGGTAADCNGHGSHVSGTVGGTTYGVAKNVQLVAVRVLNCQGSGTTAGVIAGIDWVTANKHLPAAANMSLGGGFSSSLNQAVENSVAAGVVYAIAAGNSTADACLYSPASAPSAITVGATDSGDGFAYFSNYGSCVDLNAPGVGITSAWIGSNSATNTISGTSMATPHVAGAAALYLQGNPGATAQQVRDALVNNATGNVISAIPGGTANLLLYSGFISAGGGGSNPPVASFTKSCTNLSCSFDGSGSTALSNASYSWDFGDGNNGSGKTTSHGYAAAGTYQVTLTVSDANGSDSQTQSVTVSAPPPSGPTASFSYSCSGFSCSFNGSSSTNATSYSWNFGDGGSASGVTASHSFAPRQTYTVTLTVQNGVGSNSTSKSVFCNPRKCQ